MDAKVLELLGELQSVADQVDTLEKKRSEVSDERSRIELNLDEVKQHLEGKQGAHRLLDMERRKKELHLREDKEKHQRIKGRVGDVKTSREYQAVIAETNAVKHAIQHQEEAILQDMEGLETLAADIDQLKQKIEAIEGDCKEVSERYDAVCDATERDIQRLRDEEKQLLGEIPADVVGKYRLIRSRRGGVAVVEARNEACTACYMRIPPQMYMTVLRKTQLVQCPNCHRILIPPRGEVEPMEPGLFDDD